MAGDISRRSGYTLEEEQYAKDIIGRRGWSWRRPVKYIDYYEKYLIQPFPLSEFLQAEQELVRRLRENDSFGKFLHLFIYNAKGLWNTLYNRAATLQPHEEPLLPVRPRAYQFAFAHAGVS